MSSIDAEMQGYFDRRRVEEEEAKAALSLHEAEMQHTEYQGTACRECRRLRHRLEMARYYGD